MDINASDYGMLCDVIERAYQHLPVNPDDGEWMLTSSYARAGAMRIIAALSLTVVTD